MRQPCAKSKAVEGQYGFGVVAKSKDYSIYSHVLRVVIGALLKGVRITGAPFSTPGDADTLSRLHDILTREER